MVGKKDRWFILMIAIAGIGYLIFKNYVPTIPAVDLRYEDGNQVVSLSDRSNDKIIVVFYAAWCGHCLQEIPPLVEAEKYFEEQGIEVVLLTDDSSSKISLIRDKFQISYPMHTLEGSIKSYGIFSIPTSFFYQDGELIHSFSGIIDWSSESAKILMDTHFQ